jgi:hypothetical protein
MCGKVENYFFYFQLMYKIFSIIVIFYSSILAQDNFKETVVEETVIENVTEINEYENFTNMQRIAASFLNYIPGLGFLVIMDDMTGAVVQWTLVGVGILYGAYNMNYNDDCPGMGCLGVAMVSGMLIGIGMYWGALRPLFYDKPKPNNIAYLKSDGFNVAILPYKQNSFKAYLLYNKAF